MNSRQLRQDKRNQKVMAVLDDHATELATIPAVEEAAAELQQRLALVQPSVSQQQQRRQGKGATTTKNDLEAPLIAQLVKAANALSLYYKKKAQRLDLAQALHLRRSEYEKMAQPELAREAQDIADQLASHLDDLGAYGYKKGSDKQLQAQVDAYVASLPTSSTARSQGKVGTANVRQLLRAIDTYIDGDFRSAVELLADDHPDLYQLLREAMRIDDTGAGGKKGGKNKPKDGGDAPNA